MLRPTTIYVDPFSFANAGVATRFWSSEELSANLIPGVTEIKPSSLIIPASSGEQTTPSKPAVLAFRA